MKNLLKISLAVSVLMLWLLGVNADETSSWTTSTWSTSTWTTTESSTWTTSTGSLNTSSWSTSTWSTSTWATSTWMTKDELKEKIRENIENFKEENGKLRDVLKLSDEEKAELDTLRSEHEEDVKALKAEYEAKINAATTPEAKDVLREELRTKLHELNKTYLEEMNSLVSKNEEAKAYIMARKAVFDENKVLKQEFAKSREELRWDKKEHVLKYKDKFVKSIWKKVEKIAMQKSEKLEKVLVKIDAMMDRFEANTKLSEENKTKILAQLIALKELVEDSLESVEIEQEIE